MAEVNVTVYTAGRAATSGANYTDNKTAATSADNYNVPNDGTMRLILECTAGGTALIATAATFGGFAVGDLTVTTTAAKILIWGPFPPVIFNNSANNVVVTVSANTNLFAFR